MKRRGLIFPAVVTAVATAWFVLQTLSFRSLTGHWFPQTIDEPLNDPRPVAELSRRGIILTDGTIVALPDIDKVPVDLPALVAAVEGGVEMDGDGEVFGRLRIHRWCGNDPVRKHIAKINLSDLVLAHRNISPDRTSRFYGENGLDIGQYSLLGGFQMERYLARNTHPPASSTPPPSGTRREFRDQLTKKPQ